MNITHRSLWVVLFVLSIADTVVGNTTTNEAWRRSLRVGTNGGGDPCYFPETALTPGISPVLVYVSLQRLLDCANSLTLSQPLVNLTLSTVASTIEGLYQFSDIQPNAKDLNVTATLPSWSPFNITYDWKEELASIAQRVGTSSFKLHSSLQQLFRKFNDAHTTYTPAFPFFYRRPYDVIVTADEEDGCTPRVTLKPWNVPLLPGNANAVDMYIQTYPNSTDLLTIENKTVSSINSVPILDYIQSIGDEKGCYKDKGVRFNNAVMDTDNRLSITGRSDPWPKDYVETITFSDGSSIKLDLIGIIFLEKAPTTALLSQADVQVLVDRPSNRSLQFAEAIGLSVTNIGEFNSSGVDETTSPLPRVPTHPINTRQLEASSNTTPPGVPLIANAGSVTLLFEVDGVPVLKQTSFECDGDGELTPSKCDPGVMFDVILKALGLAQKSPKKSLIVDLSGGNGGGTIWQSYAILYLLRPQLFKDPLKLHNFFDLRLSDFYDEWFKQFGGINFDAVSRSPPSTGQVQEVVSNLDAIIGISDLAEFVNQIDAPFPDISNATEVQQYLQKARVLMVQKYNASSGLAPFELSTLWKGANFETISNSTDYLLSNKQTLNRGSGPQLHTGRFLTRDFESLYRLQSELSGMIRDTSDINITFITDGRCGSACSMFLTQAMVHKIGPVVSLGGYMNQPLDTSSFGGGSVQNDNEDDSFLTRLRQKYVWSYLLSFNTIDSKLLRTIFPLFSQSSIGFTWMGIVFDGSTLPIEYYLKPAHYHLPVWTTPSPKNTAVYSTIASSGEYVARDTARGRKCGYESSGFPGLP